MEDILTSKLSIILGTNNETITSLLIKIEELTQQNKELTQENKELTQKNNNIKNDMTVLNTIKNNQIDALINMNRILNTEYIKLKNK